MTIKTLLLTALITSFYYLILLRPTIKRQETLINTKNTLTANRSVLTQKRLAYVELTRLDPDSAGFQTETANIINTLQKTQNEALVLTKEKNDIPKLKGFDINFPKLLTETENVYRQQEELIKKVLATEKYEEGLGILRSEEAIKLLTKQTNLILEYEYWLEKINRELLISN